VRKKITLCTRHTHSTCDRTLCAHDMCTTRDSRRAQNRRLSVQKGGNNNLVAKRLADFGRSLQGEDVWPWRVAAEQVTTPERLTRSLSRPFLLMLTLERRSRVTMPFFGAHPTTVIETHDKVQQKTAHSAPRTATTDSSTTRTWCTR
jgi:hypothetical protein